MGNKVIGCTECPYAGHIELKECHDGWIKDLIEELESRKDYGTEYAQAMEDVITILKAKFGIDKEDEE